jgi:hypothetical protein
MARRCSLLAVNDRERGLGLALGASERAGVPCRIGVRIDVILTQVSKQGASPQCDSGVMGQRLLTGHYRPCATSVTATRTCAGLGSLPDNPGLDNPGRGRLNLPQISSENGVLNALNRHMT